MDRWACQAPALSRPGISRPYTFPHPDRHCERKTAGREQSRYLFSCNLWAGAAPRGRERAAIPCTPTPRCPHRPLHAHMRPGSISLSATSLSTSLVFPISLPASASLLAQALPPPAGPLGPLRSLASDEPVGGRPSPGRRAGHCDCSRTRAGLSLSLSLFDLRGSFLEFIVFYCTWWGIWGWGEEKSLFSWALLVPSETFTKVVFSCLWRQPPEPPVGTGGLGWGLSRGGSGHHLGDTSPKGGLWGWGIAPPSGLETGQACRGEWRTSGGIEEAQGAMATQGGLQGQ